MSNVFEHLRSAHGTMLYGGDYNPEQWPREVWDEDMRLFKEAHINEVTLNVFSWAQLQPSEDQYDFSKLDEIINLCEKNNLRIVLATGTGAMPSWLTIRHPEVNRIGYNGERLRHSGRENFCASSRVFRHYAVKLAAKMAQRYGSRDSVVAWHVSNEYSGFCWCDKCQAGFRDWLRKRYTTIDALNEAWDNAIWSHDYHSFEEVEIPSGLGDGMQPAWQGGTGHAVIGAAALDYRRYYGELVRAEFDAEKAAVRQYDPTTPVTTNFMGTFNDYDYSLWRGSIDFVSWDSYPGYGMSAADTCLPHDLMRSMGRGKAWMLMEQAPSRQNWMPYCFVKRPGQLAEQSWQAIAHGANTIQYFQMRQSRSGCEKFHSAVIGSDGTDRTRTFKEVAALGADLERLSTNILATDPAQAQIALIFDWDSWWGLQFSVGPTPALDYVNEIRRWYSELYRRNITIDFAQAGDDLSGYKAVIAPCLFSLDEKEQANLRHYVNNGGRLLLTVMSALTDHEDSLFQGEAPVPLRSQAGVWVEETDSLDEKRPVPLIFAGDRAQSADGAVQSAQTAQSPAGSTLFDVLQADDDTQILATYGSEFYAGTPAITFHASTGQGGVLYCATLPNETAVSRVMDRFLDDLSIKEISSPQGVEIARRPGRDGASDLLFIINTTDSKQSVVCPEAGTDLLTNTPIAAQQTLDLAPYAVVVERLHETDAYVS